MSAMPISQEEKVVRLLHRIWIVDGVLQSNAFALNIGETYLSVNRPIVESFNNDVKDFLAKHIEYRKEDNYNCAVLDVVDVNRLNVTLGAEFASLSVEIEPRASHYKSHAGIFTRINGKNIKGGMSQNIETKSGQVVSTSAILQKVRLNLLKLSNLELHKI